MVFMAPSPTTAVVALILCAVVAIFSLRSVFRKGSRWHLLGVPWALLWSVFPLIAAVLTFGGTGTGRW
jgi:hypothetical protein